MLEQEGKMAAKQAWTPQQRAVEEVLFQNEAVSLCLLVNRRVHTMRVVDFRAGPSNAKRQCVLSLAKREGVEKVYTLVERDEVATWVKMGFTKEGNIPGFYKRSDAFILGYSATAAAARSRVMPAQSEMRLAVGDREAREPREPREPRDRGDELDEAHALAERTLAAAKRQAKELADRPMPSAKVAPLGESEARKAMATMLREGRALTAFEPFGRDVTRTFSLVTARGGFELVASTESQSCFGNVFLELLTSPRNDAERLCTVSALRALCDRLNNEDVVSCFGLGPSDDVMLGSAYVANGFRRTGLIEGHLIIGGERKDAILWSRKLANPIDD
jgi:hypothetical protein